MIWKIRFTNHKLFAVLICFYLLIYSYKFQNEFHIIFNLFSFLLSVAILCFQFSFEVFISSEGKKWWKCDIKWSKRKWPFIGFYGIYTVCSRTHKNLIFYSLRSFEFSSHRHVISIFKHSMEIYLLEIFLTKMFDS